jgi:hypothetical protein
MILFVLALLAVVITVTNIGPTTTTSSLSLALHTASCLHTCMHACLRAVTLRSLPLSSVLRL